MRAIEFEIASQPALWRRVAAMATEFAGILPPPGENVAAIGCGTSYYVSYAFASIRESSSLGTTDAIIPSELSPHRRYDRIVAVSRSGSTTETLRALEALDGSAPTVAITAVDRSPVARAADRSIVLDFADEQSIVQTRFATCALALMRAHLGEGIDWVADQGDAALARPLPADPRRFEHFVFLGQGWTVALANEAALKLRETAGAWTEAYPAMEYRHGPISVAGPHTLLWAIGEVDPGVLADAANTEATIVGEGLDPMAELVLVQRAAVDLAEARAMDPDNPRHLSRSVVLP